MKKKSRLLGIMFLSFLIGILSVILLSIIAFNLNSYNKQIFYNVYYLFYNKNNLVNKEELKDLKNCKIIDLYNYKRKNIKIKYLNVYKKTPQYILSCYDRKESSVTNTIGMIMLIKDNFDEYYNIYSRNHLYHELVHYNYLNILYSNPIKYLQLKNKDIKIYKELNKLCKNKKNYFNNNFNLSTYEFLKYECGILKLLKKKYSNNTLYGKAEELIAYQTSLMYYDIFENKVKYVYNVEEVTNKKMKKLLKAIIKIQNEYIYN